MKVKRYLTSDLPEAVQMIRRELGSDAIILNTKEIRTGGFMGMFRKRRVEVIAAVDETSRQMPGALPIRRPALGPITTASVAAAERPSPALPQQPQAADRPAAMPSQAVRHLYTRNVRPDEAAAPAKAAAVAVAEPDAADRSSAVSPTVGPRSVAKPSAEPAGVEAPPVGSSFGASGVGTSGAWPPSIGPSSAGPGSAFSGPPVEDAAFLMQELRSMKDMLQKLARQQSFQSMPESVLKWSRRLAEQGVEPAHVEQFAEEVRARLAGADEADEAASLEAAKGVLKSWMIHSVGDGIDSHTRIVHFVGPTGVGKTTTIAKLAADQSFTHRRTVGFITADTYRISAVDQLRTYADILNVPLEVVFSPSELARAYRKLADRDLLFMDTAGRNYRNELYVSEVNSLLAPGEKTETFLVLSLTHKYADMKALVSQFAKYGIRRLLLTKADETDTYGSLLNLVRDFSCPISYITNGQTVPDDVRAFDPEEWVHKLLGEKAYE